MEVFGALTKVEVENGCVKVTVDEPIQPFIDELKHIGFKKQTASVYVADNVGLLESAREICSFYFSAGKTMTSGNRKLCKTIEDYYSGGCGTADVDFKKTDEGIWVYSVSGIYGSAEDMAEDIKKMRASIICVRNGRRVCFTR